MKVFKNKYNGGFRNSVVYFESVKNPSPENCVEVSREEAEQKVESGELVKDVDEIHGTAYIIPGDI